MARSLVIPEDFIKAIAEKGKKCPIYSRLWLFWLAEYSVEILEDGFVEKQIISYPVVKEIKDVFDFGIPFLQQDFKVLDGDTKKKKEVHAKDILSSCRQVIEYLNSKAETTFMSKGSNIDLIAARIKEGFSVSDFKVVIDKKVDDWKGTDQAQYLRPMTLFKKSHFENYLNAQATKNKFNKFSDEVEAARQLLGIERR